MAPVRVPLLIPELVYYEEKVILKEQNIYLLFFCCTSGSRRGAGGANRSGFPWVGAAVALFIALRRAPHAR